MNAVQLMIEANINNKFITIKKILKKKFIKNGSKGWCEMSIKKWFLLYKDYITRNEEKRKIRKYVCVWAHTKGGLKCNKLKQMLHSSL